MATTPQDGAITLRNNTDENGNLPRRYSAGSPDIISAGKAPFPDPTFLEKPENYGNAYDNSLYIGWPNYLYIRGKNFGTKDVAGQWNLFWAEPNILLYPFLWQQNQLATSDGNMAPPFNIKAGAIGASTNAFRWVPQNVSDHYCMIAVALSQGFPNPLQGVNKVTSLAETLANYPNIAQRNMQMIRGAVPQMVSRAAYTQGDETQTMDLVVHFQNIPKGSAYTVSSGTPLNGETLRLDGTDTKTNNFKIGWTDKTVPAQWSTMFDWTLVFGNDWSGIPVGNKPTVTVRGEILMETGHRLYNHPAARLADPDFLTGHPRLDKLGNPYKIMTAGTVSAMAPDMGP